jgi:hypothetical protein
MPSGRKLQGCAMLMSLAMRCLYVFLDIFFFQPLPISKYAVVKKKVVKGKMIVGMALFQK